MTKQKRQGPLTLGRWHDCAQYYFLSLVLEKHPIRIMSNGSMHDCNGSKKVEHALISQLTLNHFLLGGARSWQPTHLSSLLRAES